MYESPNRRLGRRAAGARARQVPVGSHYGSDQDYLRRHEVEATAAASGDQQQRDEFFAALPARTADPRNLRCAIDHLTRNGVKAPGPNGHRLESISSQDLWSLARTLGRAMTSGYRCGSGRVVNVPKTSGVGTRSIHVLNIEDRITHRAIAQTAQPYLDARFSDRSLGYRPGRGREEALGSWSGYGSMHMLVGWLYGVWCVWCPMVWLLAPPSSTVIRPITAAAAGRFFQIGLRNHHQRDLTWELVRRVLGQPAVHSLDLGSVIRAARARCRDRGRAK